MSCANSAEGVDLVDLILRTVEQIPQGRVSTFGDVAVALGDVRAARAVGVVLGEAASDSSVPGHRVVLSDGRLWARGGEEVRTAGREELLRREGIEMDGGAVLDLEMVRFRDFEVTPILTELQVEQTGLRSLVVESDGPRRPRFAEGLDVSYSGERACVALVRMDLETLDVIEERLGFGEARFPYIPGYLGYRELPMAMKVVEARPDTVLLIDGHGVLHPRGFGVACHIGVRLGVPTVGAAKSLLLGEVAPGGERADVLLDGRVRGRRIRPRGRRATYVSVGHMISLESACGICERLMLRGVPEPLRLAHILATRERKRMELIP